uniref:ADP,ATP carrier protein n=2 Tax=Pyramimonas obovata TaxID=1411642 RepID=A0A7S0N204_9CHLO|mmetsp:Transcript_16359/g.35555  ORF Transcript_16359/g.35555 Transcript_16359/m.35555 type:complete len:311 (+) Transcript_16359:193-1125(+)|eukprot:CAMPEP_0118941844 /NCGR_PEP_ID=MMETSP1169-20130426/34792_1 /TAXON_ID=36882 /ORGANISM="Pyramimonas obovata, Strain CCMP722" /LENGTH=310 /DNA_ID=CAMNT_0006886707 /DNA_START=114 /DNA_END=1046 /DNA_ORIENTATION=+
MGVARVSPDPGHEVLAGFLSGVADAFATHPVDQVKTQFHVNRGSNPSVVASLMEQARTGGASRLYRGVLAACLRPQSLCMYTGNEWAKRIVAGDGQLTYKTAPVAGFLTGYIEAAAVTPFEVVKVRMQSKDHLWRYQSSMQCAHDVVRTEGPRALYNGFGATCARNSTFNGAYFGLVFVMKDNLPSPASFAGEVAHNLGTGMAAGTLATCVKQPFDVVKSRLQNQLPGADAEYRHVSQAMVRIAQTEGPRALYKGFVPTVLRMSLGQGVALAAFDFTLQQVQRMGRVDANSLPAGLGMSSASCEKGAETD